MKSLQRGVYRLLSAVGIGAVLLVSACDTDFLNTEPLDSISSDATWADGPLSEAFIYNVYSFLGYGGFEEQMLASITDEAMFTHAGRNINTFTEGTESPANLGWMSPTYYWDNMYLAIRQANIALQELPNSTFDNDDLRDRLMGEAHFLRAYYYHQLARFYGGVPLVEKPYGLNEDYEVPRATWEETVNFIVADLDKAAELLAGKPETDGRASRLSALALKSRILLYAASDLHYAPAAGAVSSTLASYPHLDLLAYSGGDREARWRAARDAARMALEEGTGYKLGLTEPVSPEEGRQNYISLSMGGGSSVGDAAAAEELILQRTVTPLYTQESNWPLGPIHFGINNGPNGYHNWAGNTPIQQLVDDYEMMDGSTFDWDNPDHAANPYEDRDPRFYATVMYDGSGWKPRPSDVAPIDPYDEIQTGYYDDGKGGFIPGVDTRESSVENWNGSRTHYYVRKFIDPDPALKDNQSNAQVIPWPFIRYTEVVLNYVETCLELGNEAEARDWLNQVRFRVGMPAVQDSGEDLMYRYRNERRIELAYEEHRYHDARRWLIAEETQGRPIEIIDVRATLKPGKQPRVPYKYDPSVYDYEYTVATNTENESRSWSDKMYFRAISRDEISRNPQLVQNPGF
ncbi:RagB/SusD family nutrient uptake outer membrane protein [Neolewinella litorea]|uniref:RagB/SusD family nutrient uptake outer membrane protein n=1 Tax=Neolewinella litorea TaxID=2562452 RepID=A0A4S4NN76_9BACT|nr:RagB/SusD family nutrient uptake outer membrane protein [Neolewinella litorea]THH41429.1 RagB/SusD family nutrient uptake outer membrane protein [Neolewinella litorea]